MKFLLFSVFFFVLLCSLSQAAPLRVTDEVGRAVTVASFPKRVVSLAPNVTEILFSLGLTNEIVGVSSDSNYPEEATKKARVGTYLAPDFERIVSLQPDLIIATGAGNTRTAVERLGRFGLAVYVIFPKNVEGIESSILHLGQVLDREKEAIQVVREMERRKKRIMQITEGLRRPKVFLLVGEAPIVTVGRGSFGDDLIRLAGGENIAAEEREMYPRLGMEEILRRSPEVLLISSMNPQADYGRVLREWNRWITIPAVRNKRIHLIDSDLIDRPSPRIIEGLEEMARLLHPELFGKMKGF